MAVDINEFKEAIIGTWSIDNRLIEVKSADDIAACEVTPLNGLKVELSTIRTMLITSISPNAIEFINVDPIAGGRTPKVLIRKTDT